MPKFKADEFWQFSLAFYSLEDNKDILLWMQDEGDVNVNWVLCQLYLVRLGFLLKPDSAQEMSLAIRVQDQETKILRKKRRDTGRTAGKNSARYKLALEQELECEKRQQAGLISWLNDNQELLESSAGEVAGQQLAVNLIQMFNAIQEGLETEQKPISHSSETALIQHIETLLSRLSKVKFEGNGNKVKND